MKIYDVDVNVQAHKDNKPEEQVAVFAHLKGKEKADAVQQLRDAIAKKEPADKPIAKVDSK